MSGDARKYSKCDFDLAEIIRTVMELFHRDRDAREHQARLLLSSLIGRSPTSSEQKIGLFLQCINDVTALLIPEIVQHKISKIWTDFDGEVSHNVENEWQLKAQSIEKEYACIRKDLQNRVRSELPLRFQNEIEKHCGEVFNDASAQVEKFLGGRRKDINEQNLNGLMIGIIKIVSEKCHKWFASNQDKFADTLWDIAGESVDQIVRLNGDVLEFVSRLFGIQLPSAKWTINKDETDFSLKITVPFNWHPKSGWELDILPIGWARKKLFKRYIRVLELTNEEYRDAIIHTLTAMGLQCVDRLSFISEDRMRTLSLKIGESLTGQIHSFLSNSVDLILNRLETIRHALVKEVCSETVINSHAKTDSSIANRCLICERIENELFGFFTKHRSKGLGEMAEQNTHESTGNFCPLHTWQYVSVSSPDGISREYAPLLSVIADKLYDLASSAATVDSLRDNLQCFSFSASTCPACRRVAEAEKTAIKEFRETYFYQHNENIATGLCIPHLAVLLNEETDFEKARSLIYEQAGVFACISEDMQTYSLKHDALRRELIDDEELSAYFRGLSLLAGHKKLSTA